jgi:hypothetical protein
MLARWHVPKSLAAILLLALMLRLGALVAVDRIVAGSPGRFCLIDGDAEGYWDLGRKIRQGDDYALYAPPRYCLRMPGFPLLLAVAQWVGQERVWVARVMLVLLSTAGCVATFLLGQRLFGTPVGLGAAAATAASPALVGFSPLILTEAVFATAVTFSLWLIARLVVPGGVLRGKPVALPTGLPPTAAPGDSEPFAVPRVRLVQAVGAGVMIAVATLLRPTWLPVAGASAVALWWNRRGKGNGLAEAVLLSAACAMVLSPWVIRNALVTGHLVITTLWSGPSLYDGMHPQATGESDMRFFETDVLMARMTEYEMNAEYRRRAWAFAAQNPWRAVELAAIKQARYWSPWPNARQFANPWLGWALMLGTVPLYAGAVLAIVRGPWTVMALLLTAGPIVYFAALHLLYVGSVRYRLPAEPALWVLAAAGWHQVWQWCQQRWLSWSRS